MLNSRPRASSMVNRRNKEPLPRKPRHTCLATPLGCGVRGPQCRPAAAAQAQGYRGGTHHSSNAVKLSEEISATGCKQLPTAAALAQYRPRDNWHAPVLHFNDGGLEQRELGQTMATPLLLWRGGERIVEAPQCGVTMRVAAAALKLVDIIVVHRASLFLPSRPLALFFTASRNNS